MNFNPSIQFRNLNPLYENNYTLFSIHTNIHSTMQCFFTNHL